MKLEPGVVLTTKHGNFVVKKVLSRNRLMVKKVAKELLQKAAIEELVGANAEI